MILNFVGLNSDRSHKAKEFYLALSPEYVPERRLTKDEFIKHLEPGTTLQQLAEATQFETITKAGDRIVLTFPKGIKAVLTEEDDDLIGIPVKKLVEEDDDLIGDIKPKKTKPVVVSAEGVEIGKTTGWFISKGQRIEGVIQKDIMSHDKPYYGIMFNGKIKYKLKSEVNIL